MNQQLNKGLLAFGLVAVPAAIVIAMQMDRAEAQATEPGTAQVQEQVLGADAFELSGIELQNIEPFTMRAGAQEGARIERIALIQGSGFYGTAFGPFVTLDGVDAPGVEMLDDTTLKVYLPADLYGSVEFGVRLSDGRSASQPVQL